jgi:hypothetical protein
MVGFWLSLFLFSAGCSSSIEGNIVGHWQGEPDSSGRYAVILFKDSIRAAVGSGPASNPEGINLHRSSYRLTEDSLVMYFEPEASRYAWVVEWEDENNLVLQSERDTFHLKRKVK